MLLTVPRRWFWYNSYFMLIGVGVSCCISYSIVSYLYVSFRALITSLGEERASFSAIVYLQLCGFCLEGFLFILVLGIGCVISLWHSLGLPYNYFEQLAPVCLPRNMTASCSTPWKTYDISTKTCPLKCFKSFYLFLCVQLSVPEKERNNGLKLIKKRTHCITNPTILVLHPGKAQISQLGICPVWSFYIQTVRTDQTAGRI